MAEPVDAARGRPDCSTCGAALASLGAWEPAGCPDRAGDRAGWLRLAFRKDEALGRTVLSALERRAPLLAQKALYWDSSLPDMACVTAITSSGCVVQGDRLALQIEVGEGARAQVLTQSATKVHSMEQGRAVQLQCFRLEEGGWLEYVPDPLILHRSSRYAVETCVALPASAVFLYGETLVPGRRWHHEEELFGFDRYSAGIRVCRPQGSGPLVEERVLLEPQDMEFRLAGIMGGFDIFGSLFAFLPEAYAAALCREAGAGVGADLCWGASLLPNGAGVVFRVLGRETEAVQGMVRRFRSLVRERLLGKTLPPEFLWR